MTAPSRAPGIYGDIDERTYHADRESLSHSGAKLLLPPSCPAKFKERMDNPLPPTPTFSFGHLAHKLVLGEGAVIREIEAVDYRTKAAQQQRDEALAAGEIPALTPELAKAVAMADAVREHPVASKLFATGRAEMSMYADDPDTGWGLRGRADWLTRGEELGLGDRLVIVDYKTTVDANPSSWGRSAANYGYALQFAWYVELARLVNLDDWPAFLFVCQEKEPPYLVSVNELDAEAWNLGYDQMRHAIAVYAECMESGVWPGYSDGINPVSLPRWAFKDLTPEP